ncbi:MAG TPA: hypothetical protein VFP59_13110 [Candidatus Angelobacter sp.]|nr:hypothetical protein [Candidatus Angelobacter sp.]
MKILLSMMRMFHYIVGITAPDKEHEKQTFFVWLGVGITLLSLGFLFALFISHEVFK